MSIQEIAGELMGLYPEYEQRWFRVRNPEGYTVAYFHIKDDAELFDRILRGEIEV